ncbi:MAG: enoyl-CoA hydratase/isomerase family protein [Phycisphaerales bacterium]
MLLTDSNDGITSIRFDRAEKRNALTPDMLAALRDAVAAASVASRVIVLGGEGESFCAGFDLSLCRGNERGLDDLLRGLFDAVAALRRSPCPVVVAAHGAAIAGGCALLGGADFVITNSGAKFGYPVVRLGISPAVTAPFLREFAGDGGARALLLEGLIITGHDAWQIGLASDCVDQAQDVWPRAEQIARGLAAKPAPGLRATRRWLDELSQAELTNRAPTMTERAGLEASLSVAGNAESRARLARLWEKP